MKLPAGATAALHRRVRRLRPHAPALLLALAAFAAGLAVTLGVFPHLSWNSDEGVYLAQAEALHSGRLTWPVATHDPFFQPWLTGEHDGHFFTKYLPGYPAVLATATLVTGTPAIVPPISAALCVLGVYALSFVLFASRRIALLAATFTLCSPLLLIHSGLYLTYTFTTALLFFAVAFGLRGAQRSSRSLLLLAGLLGASATLFRSYDVLLIAAPTAVYVILRHVRSFRGALTVTGWPLLGALPPLAVLLAYNRAVTGSPLRMPLPATDPLDTFGFGMRRLLPTSSPRSFQPADAVDGLLGHLAVVPYWMAGGLLLPLFALAGLWLGDRRRRPERLLVAALILAFPLGYFPFWGTALSVALGLDRLGPFYYTAALAALTIAAAVGVDSVASRLARTRLRPVLLPATALLTTVAVMLTAASVWQKVEKQQHITARAKAVLGAIPPTGELKTPAVILVETAEGQPYVGEPYAFLRNDADLRNPVLYASSTGAADRRIFSLLPDHAVYRLRLPYFPENRPPRVPEGSFVPLTSVQGRALEVQTTFRSPVAGTCLTAFAYLGETLRLKPLGCDAVAGQTYGTRWTLGPSGDLPLPRAGDEATFVTGVVAGPDRSHPGSPAVAVWEVRHNVGVDVTADGPQAQIVLPGEGRHRPAAPPGSPEEAWRPLLPDQIVGTAAVARG